MKIQDSELAASGTANSTPSGGVHRSTSQQLVVNGIELEPGSTGGELTESTTPEDATAAGPERAAWGSQAEFILTMIGYAVGLGNVWRFPYLCYRNGGGAFLIPYFGTLALVGLPLFFMELAFGQFASLGPIAAWTLNPMFKGLGYSMVIINTAIGVYYNVIISWTIYYFFASMTSRLPWSDCGNSWNTDYCVTPDDVKNFTGNFTIINNVTVTRENMKTPSEEYFYNNVLGLSSGIDEMGTVVWTGALCLLLSWTVVFFVLIKGISSLGKVVYFTSIFPYVILTIMLIRGVTLEGAGQGILYYLKPNFSKLSDARAWSDAATQIFFSLSTCTGGLMAMASYNPFKNNCLRDSIMVPIINCGTSFYAGFAIFSVLGYMAHQKGVSVADVAASGPGLVFVVFPEGLTTMPVAPLWSILFFIMMMTLGFSSEFSIIECFFSAVLDEFPMLLKTRRRAIAFRAIGCTFFFLIGLSMVTKGGFYLFNLADYYVGGFPLLIVGFLECVALMYIYGYKNFAEDIEMMLGRQPTIYFRITWCIIAPLILFVIIIFMSVQYSTPTLFSDRYIYPSWAQGIGWAIVIGCIFLIPVWFLTIFFKQGGYELLKKLCQPTPEWGPANAKHRTGKYEKKMNISTSTADVKGDAEVTSSANHMNGSTNATVSSHHYVINDDTRHFPQCSPPPYGSDNSAYTDDDIVVITSFKNDDRQYSEIAM